MPLLAATASWVERSTSPQDVLRQVRQDVHGCTNVFLDLGANIGVSSRFLFEPHKYPDATFLKVLDMAFGTNSDNARYEAGAHTVERRVDGGEVEFRYAATGTAAEGAAVRDRLERYYAPSCADVWTMCRRAVAGR